MDPRVKQRYPPDILKAKPGDLVQAYLRKHTGVTVSKYQIGRWITTGEIRTMRLPRDVGGGIWTRRAWLDELIERNS